MATPSFSPAMQIDLGVYGVARFIQCARRSSLSRPCTGTCGIFRCSRPVIVILMPALRKDSSRRRWLSVVETEGGRFEYLCVGLEGYARAGLVGAPYDLELAAALAAFVSVAPRPWPSRLISTSSHSLRKFTTVTPTPCSPPETL